MNILSDTKYNNNIVEQIKNKIDNTIISVKKLNISFINFFNNFKPLQDELKTINDEIKETKEIIHSATENKTNPESISHLIGELDITAAHVAQLMDTKIYNHKRKLIILEKRKKKIVQNSLSPSILFFFEVFKKHFYKNVALKSIFQKYFTKENIDAFNNIKIRMFYSLFVFNKQIDPILILNNKEIDFFKNNEKEFISMLDNSNINAKYTKNHTINESNYDITFPKIPVYHFFDKYNTLIKKPLLHMSPSLYNISSYVGELINKNGVYIKKMKRINTHNDANLPLYIKFDPESRLIHSVTTENNNKTYNMVFGLMSKHEDEIEIYIKDGLTMLSLLQKTRYKDSTYDEYISIMNDLYNYEYDKNYKYSSHFNVRDIKEPQLRNVSFFGPL